MKSKQHFTYNRQIKSIIHILDGELICLCIRTQIKKRSSKRFFLLITPIPNTSVSAFSHDRRMAGKEATGHPSKPG
jgi:hypothetical protein